MLTQVDAKTRRYHSRINTSKLVYFAKGYDAIQELDAAAGEGVCAVREDNVLRHSECVAGGR